MSGDTTIALSNAPGGNYDIVPISHIAGVDRLPFSLRILLENLLRQTATRNVDTSRQVTDLLARRTGAGLTFYPARIFGQDILGKVMLIDMAALRDALAEAGRDPRLVNPAVPIDIIVDHSLQVDRFATPDAARFNLDMEYRRNQERFAFLRWCGESFRDVRVVPPGKGIMHQIHLESIGQVVWQQPRGSRTLLFPDTCVGTDSHTPMINGLGILGWGVGGIEAEAVMVGRPVAIALPEVIGVEVKGRLGEGVTPTDLVLAITQKLRAIGVVDKFVEFFGPGLETLSVGDRGTISNMAPEYGATAVYFPIDSRTRDYLRMTARPAPQVAMIEAYAREQKLWRDPDTKVPEFDSVITVDLGAIRPCLAGPKNPEERLDLDAVAPSFPSHVQDLVGRPLSDKATPVDGRDFALRDGDVVIAAITSCTNTSNPTGMIAAGLLARNAVAKGLVSKPWVKTSLAPGSHVAAAALERAGLQPALDLLGFNVVGFGCTTCNGGSGPLPEPIARAINADGIVAAAVLSGNRNFQGRVHPDAQAGYLASPALVVAYAIAGSMMVDLVRDPLGMCRDGKPVFLRDIWPSSSEIAGIVDRVYDAAIFADKYRGLFDGGEPWAALAGTASDRFDWSDDSTYVRKPPYFDGLTLAVPTPEDIVGARPLAILGDSITTDHISPSGAISLGTPAADFMLAKGIAQVDFNNYTTRRGNHEIAVRATFANIRLRNRMTPGVEGGMTKLMPEGKVMRIFDAAEAYRARAIPLVVVAGRNYGCGSSRDWAAKGVALLGVKAIIAREFERIHRTNLIGMGVLPLQFTAGVTAETLNLDGSETFDIAGLSGLGVAGEIACTIRRADGSTATTTLLARLDTDEDLLYWRNGGILPAVWREYVSANPTTARKS